MGILDKIKQAANAVQKNVGTYIVRPTLSFIAGPVSTYGALGIVEVSAGQVGIPGVTVDAINSTVSSLVSTGAMRATENAEVFTSKPKAADETSSLLPLANDDVENLLIPNEPVVKTLNKKGETFVFVIANLLGCGVGFAAKQIMIAKNFPADQTNLNTSQQELADHMVVTSAASMAGMLAQKGAKYVAQKISFFTQPASAAQQLDKLGHVQGGYQTIASNEEDNFVPAPQGSISTLINTN